MKPIHPSDPLYVDKTIDYVNEQKKDYSVGLNVITAVTGALHFGLSLAAEAVLCGEATIVNKMTDGKVSYAQAKLYRQTDTYRKIDNVKVRVREVKTKMDRMQAEAKAKAIAARDGVQLKTA
jgi:hypothetical protein